MLRLSIRTARAASAALVVPMALVACSALESLDGYAGSPALDAGVALEASTEASTDVGIAQDSGAPDDAKGDVEARANAPYCASLSPAPLFCDDFDTVDLAQKWDEVHTTGGHPARTMAAFTSPPYALAVPVDALASGAPLWGVIIKTFTPLSGRPLRGTSSIDLRIDVADTNAGSAAVVWALHYEGTNGVYWELQLVANYDGNRVSIVVAEVGQDATVGQFYRDTKLGHTMMLGEWHRLRVDVALGRIGGPPLGTNSAQIYFDGLLDGAMPLTNPIVSAPPQLYLGTGYVHTPSTPWQILYDDAMIDLTAQ